MNVLGVANPASQYIISWETFRVHRSHTVDHDSPMACLRKPNVLYLGSTLCYIASSSTETTLFPNAVSSTVVCGNMRLMVFYGRVHRKRWNHARFEHLISVTALTLGSMYCNFTLQPLTHWVNDEMFDVDSPWTRSESHDSHYYSTCHSLARHGHEHTHHPLFTVLTRRLSRAMFQNMRCHPAVAPWSVLTFPVNLSQALAKHNITRQVVLVPSLLCHIDLSSN